MLIRGKDIINAKIYTMDTGKEVDYVDDVIYNPQTNRVEAFLVSSGGLFSEPQVILFSDAAGVGRDALMVKNKEAVRHASELKESLASIITGNNFLTQDKIITENGAYLGQVTDILFDNQTGEVKELEVSRGLEDIVAGKKLVKVADIITVGTDAVIVRANTEKKLEQQDRAKIMGGEVMKQAPKYIKRAEVKVQELAGRAAREAQELRRSPQAKRLEKQAREEIERIQKRAKEIRENPKVKKAVRQLEREADYLRDRAVQAIQTTKPKRKKTGTAKKTAKKTKRIPSKR